MPTPSPNNSPPGLHARTRNVSSTCPDDVRTSTERAETEGALAATEGRVAPEPDSTRAIGTNTGPEIPSEEEEEEEEEVEEEEDAISRRSHTDSPRPDSRTSGVGTESTNLTEDDTENTEGGVAPSETFDAIDTRNPTRFRPCTPGQMYNGEEEEKGNERTQGTQGTPGRVGTRRMRDASTQVTAADIDQVSGDKRKLPSSGAFPVFSSSYLRHGSRFRGFQRSERQEYEVEVQIKHVDLAKSFMCGYLQIRGLTKDHPTLTTFFEGEIIGPQYSLVTRHPEWGVTDRIDFNHWSKFREFRALVKKMRGPIPPPPPPIGAYNDAPLPSPLHSLVSSPPFRHAVLSTDTMPSCPEHFARQECLFMRWKEKFLVPDHKVKTISGASFEGFYYICFDQRCGAIHGIYYHQNSDNRFQRLELKHVPDRGCFYDMEFR